MKIWKILGIFVIVTCSLFLFSNSVDALENHEDFTCWRECYI